MPKTFLAAGHAVLPRLISSEAPPLYVLQPAYNLLGLDTLPAVIHQIMRVLLVDEDLIARLMCNLTGLSLIHPKLRISKLGHMVRRFASCHYITLSARYRPEKMFLHEEVLLDGFRSGRCFAT